MKWRDQSSELIVSEVESAGTPSYHRLRLGDLIAVDVRSERRLLTAVSANIPQHTLDHFLADQVIPRVMAHEGSFVVHAGAVRVGTGAILMMGRSGGGKSTLSTSFDQAGFPMLGDDAMNVTQVDGGPCATAVYPSLRLLPDSIDALFPNAVESSAVAHYSAKRRVSLPSVHPADARPLPIRATFVLAGPVADGRIDLRRLTEKEACMSSIDNSFALDPSDTARARDRLAIASALAGQVPTFEIAYPRDYARLPEVRQAILHQLAAMDAA